MCLSYKVAQNRLMERDTSDEQLNEGALKGGEAE